MSETPYEFAWRVHSALDAWTAKVDSKASIILGLETASIGFIVALATADHRLAHLRGMPLTFLKIGLVFLAIGVLLAGLTVFPQLSRLRARRIWKDNVIYFGHVRRWSPEDLEKRLSEMTEGRSLEQLANQLVEMSEIAWRKHAWLQYSMLSTLVGLTLVILTAMGIVK